MPVTPFWQGFLASFYGGITEELLLRLGLFSTLAWLLDRISRTPQGMPTVGSLWASNISAAPLFGIGYLPATAALVDLTPEIIIRALALNGIVGLAFGHLYWTRGLIAAILAHFSADIVLHVITPILFT